MYIDSCNNVKKSANLKKSATIMIIINVQVSVTARDDVPFFGPALPDPAIFKKVS